MNEKIKELLTVAKDYIEHLEYKIQRLEDKNNQGLMSDNDIAELERVNSALYNTEISIKANDNDVGSNVKEDLIKLGMKEEDFDMHESDLYVKKTPVSEKYLETYKWKNNVTTFKNQREPNIGEVWYDFSFANDAFWESKVKSSIKEDIIELYATMLNEFTAKLTDIDKIEANVIEEKFNGSEDYKKFSNIVFDNLTKALTENKISAKEYDEIIEAFDIKASDDEIKKIVSEDIPPKPTDIPPMGKKYTWDAKAKLWVLTDLT
jgi:hypothetical protein